MEINKGQLGKFKNLVERAASIVLVPHKNTDGDAIGSVLGWWNLLKNRGFEVSVVVPDEVPANLMWMNGATEIIVYENNQPLGDSKLTNADILVFLDFNNMDRCGDMGEVVNKQTSPKVLIDHHPDPDTGIADVLFSETAVSSTCELSYLIIESLGWDKTVDVCTAECFYAGIITDTGSLSYNSSDPRTYKVVGDLVDKGIDKENIHKELFQSNSLERMKLLGHVLSDNLEIIADVATAFITISKDELKRYQYQPGDTEGFVNYPLAIKGIDISALFTEKEKGKFVKISFRSRSNIPVNKYSEAFFSGGGHMNAAGGEWKGTLREAVQRFKETFPVFLASM